LNYLAHAYLSFNQPEILAGNMISDFVRGKKKFDYSDLIQRGIALHRSIDGFTDDHPATREAKKWFRPAYGLYSGAFVDIVYDHFLALDPAEFPGDSLAVFARNTYLMLGQREPGLPDGFRSVFHHMRLHDWLSNYRYKEAIKRSFGGLVHRAAYMHEHETAFGIFERYYKELKKDYQDFFPALKSFAREQFTQLTQGLP